MVWTLFGAPHSIVFTWRASIEGIYLLSVLMHESGGVTRRHQNIMLLHQYLQDWLINFPSINISSLTLKIFQFNIGESTQFYWPRFNAVNVGSSSRNRKLFRLLMFSGPAGPAQPFTVKIRISTRIQKFVHQNTVCKTRNFSCKVYYEVVPGYKYSSLS